MAPQNEPPSGVSRQQSLSPPRTPQQSASRPVARPPLPRSTTSQRPLIIDPATPSRQASPVSTRSHDSQTPSKKWTRGPYFWRSFITMCLPLLLSALEASITNTALPTISEELNLGTNFSWAATAFLLASTVFQPLYGQLADLYGRKIPMMIAVTIFGAGSAISGCAKGTTSIILGRVIQGFGTGGIDLFAEIILSDLVPLRQRGLYMSIKNGVFALGTTVGPMLGGFFAEWNWRWCFWINLPVCVLSFIMMIFWLRVEGGDMKNKSAAKELRSVDYFGVILLTSSVVLLLIALSSGGTTYPWSSEKIIIPLVFGILLLIIFPLWERSRMCVRPIMPPAIFAKRTSSAALTLTTIHGFITYGTQFFLPAFFQAVKRVNPSKSGVLVLPTTLTIVVMATVGGPILAHFGKYRPIHVLSYGLITFGLGFFMVLNKDTPTTGHIFMQFNAAVGLGLIVPTLLPAVQVELEDSQNGAAAGSWAFLRGTGSLFGVAIPGALFNYRFAQLLHLIKNNDAQNQFSNGKAYQQASHILDLTDQYGAGIEDQVVHVFTESLRSVWIIMIVLAFIGFTITFLERQVKMRRELDTEFGLSSEKKSPAGFKPWKKGSNNTPGDGDALCNNSSNSTLVDLDLEKGDPEETPEPLGLAIVEVEPQPLSDNDDGLASSASSINEKDEDAASDGKHEKTPLRRFFPERNLKFPKILPSGRFSNVPFLRRGGQGQ